MQATIYLTGRKELVTVIKVQGKKPARSIITEEFAIKLCKAGLASEFMLTDCAIDKGFDLCNFSIYPELWQLMLSELPCRTASEAV